MADAGKIVAVFTVLSFFCQVFASVGDNCKKATTCEPLETDLCLGTKLSHTHTSTILANDSSSQDDVRVKLALWRGLQNVPRCWEVIQPLLCAVYMPKCENGFVELPSMDICSVTRGPCKIVEVDRGWPSFLQCDQDHFREGCDNTYAQLTFNTTSGCEPPLVETDNDNSWYEGVEGCGIQCKNPLFTDKEHDQVHLFIAIMASICVVCTFFTLATFFADWKNSNKYPALILFYMNGCFFVGSIGWLAQFTEGARDDIVCRRDGTLRLAEPSQGENLSCVIIFIIVYYFLMAGVSWFVMLTYAWHLSFSNLGTSKGDALQGKVSYFHIICWSLPLVLVIIILAVGEVDGDSVSGICFVGYKNHYFRGGFVLAPIAVVLTAGGFFLTRGLATLCSVKKSSPELLNDRASHKIKETIVRIGVFALLCFLFVFTTFACHVYDFSNQHLWKIGFRDYILCEANVTIYKELDMDPVTCSINPRPSLAIYLVHLASLFGAGIVMSTWVWTPSTLQIWQRMWRKVTMQPINEPQRVKKSRMIAKAFARRVNRGGDEVSDDDKISISFETVSHDDPLGMDLELNKSCTSTDSSSQWTNVPMRMLTRRGATVLPPSSSTSTTPTPEPYDCRQLTPTELPEASLIIEKGKDRSPMKKHKNRTRKKRREKPIQSFHRPTNLISEQHVSDSAEDLQADFILMGPRVSGISQNVNGDEPTESTSVDENNRSTVPKLPAISHRRVNIVGGMEPLRVLGLPGQSDT